ncbi:MAG: PEP-CTERM sorting domain-containing protein [Rubrivivax sp.]|nr:PEP-CTERM sorting domain-containing protein [Rubrivivax sp.]
MAPHPRLLALPLLCATAVALGHWGAAVAPVAHVGVGARLFAPGEAFDGDELPADHALSAPASAALPAHTVAADAGAQRSRRTAGPRPPLELRRFCAWGRPGRMPYRGTPEEAMRAAQLPAEVRAQIAAAIAAGRADDRLVIGNDAIRSTSGARTFPSDGLAMTYGRTLCLGTRVNFKPGHEEMAHLYEATDTQGRLYSVMVPQVCGNVTVLRQPHVSSQLALQRDPWDAGDAGTRVAHAVMAAKPHQVPEPGSLALGLAALAAAAAFTRRHRARPRPSQVAGGDPAAPSRR